MQLAHAEWLGDEIVRSHFERRDLVALPIARRYDENRGRGFAAKPLNHDCPVHVGKPEIEQDEVGPAAFPRSERLRGGPDFGHSVAVGGEVAGEQPPGLRLVLDDEDVGRDGRGVDPRRSSWVGHCVVGIRTSLGLQGQSRLPADRSRPIALQGEGRSRSPDRPAHYGGQ